MHACDRANLCGPCLTANIEAMHGPADLRGLRWAQSVALRATPEQRAVPWPDTPKMLAIARAKVGDLGRDERLLGRLVEVCVAAARREWERGR